MSLLDMQVAALMRLCMAEEDEERDKIRESLRNMMMARHRPEHDIEREVRKILLELGAPDHLVGHSYAVRAIVLAVEDERLARNMTTALYPKLAQLYEVTPAKIERGIRHLIGVTWVRADDEAIAAYFGRITAAYRTHPSNAEFIARLANEVRQRMKEAA